MSQLTIPCTRPWTSATIINVRDMVKLTVGTGNRIREYEIHADVLKERSGYFRKKLHNNPEKGKKRPPMQLSDETPAVFDVFAAWLYQGNRCRLGPTGSTSYLSLCQLFKLATVFEVPLFRNTIIDAFLYKVHRDAPRLPYDVAAYLEEHGRDTALHDMLIDIILNCGEMEKVQDWKISLAKGFFVRSVFVEGGIVPFGKSADVRGYLELLGRQACERYHEHPDGDEVADDGGEMFFFDPPLE